VLAKGGKKDLHCFLCESDFYLVDKCEGCGGPALRTTISPWSGDNYCEDCIREAGDVYVQAEIDRMRGR
jgi:hypothetical protein